ncbi:hypothetical protein BGZ95_008308 [Linnemannia exigua]|uniref:Uncharacterized protein n=1 Tax=Linnemannia exigua TaxID=604196 RepID=A0AAD4DEK9_9FUNG|nr:hypothetical protein BGZ95_008308 [Linnemannia exigua]
MLARNLKSLLTCNFTNEQKQPVRVHNTYETRYVPIRPNPNQGGPPIVDWSEIKSHFPDFTLAEPDFERDSSSDRLLTPLRIRAQHLEIVVYPVETTRDMIAKVLQAANENHAENLAQHRITHESIETVRKAVEASLRTLFELPDHDIPRMFIIVPESTARLNPSRLLYRSYRLHFLCECGDFSGTSNSTDGGISHHMHFTDHEGYEIRTPKAFIQKYGSHMIKLLDVIKGLAAVNDLNTLAILKASGLPTQLADVIRSTEDGKCLPGIKEIAEHLQQVLNPTDGTVDANHCQVLDDVELRAIKSFLVRKDARQTLGNLYRILTPEKKIKWVCRDHVQKNVKGNDFANLRHAIGNFGATLDESRGRVTVQLSSKNAVKFFEIVSSKSNIQELDINLDFSPSTDQIRKLRHAIKSSQVSRLIISIKAVGDKYIIPGVIRKVSGGGQLLKLFSFKKLSTPKPFRNLSIRGVPDILEEYAYGKSNKCLAYSLDLDRVSFNWDREESRTRLLELLDWAPSLSRLRLWSGTVSEGYNMVQRLAEKSHRLTAVEITTGSEERVVVFKLNAGMIVSIDASLKASELGTVSGWGDKLESLAILLDDNYCSWEALRTILAKSPILARLELHWPVEQFSNIFQNIQSLVGPDLSLATLCLRHGTSHKPADTTTIEMLPEEERHLGFWKAYSLFGAFPAYSAIPCQLTDEQFDVFQDYYSKSEESIRPKELNLDVSMLSPQGIKRLESFLTGHRHVKLRLSGSWTQYLHDLIIARFEERLTGFDMVAHLSGPSPLTNGATDLINIFELFDATVTVPGARMRFKTDRDNTIAVSKLQDLITASFEIIQEDEPFDFVLSQRFRCLPSKLYCLDRFSDSDVKILQELVNQTPDQIRYLYLSIRGLSTESMPILENIVCGLSSNAELKVYWDGHGDLEDSLYTKFQFLSKVASRTRDLVLENISSLGTFGTAFFILKWPVATLLRTVSLRNIQVTGWLLEWMALWITEPMIQLKSLRIEGLEGMDSSQWSPILRRMNFAALESVVLLSSRVPVEQLQDIVDSIPSSGGVLTRLQVQVDETPNWTLFGMRRAPERIPFENKVKAKVPDCRVTINYVTSHR